MYLYSDLISDLITIDTLADYLARLPKIIVSLLAVAKDENSPPNAYC